MYSFLLFIHITGGAIAILFGLLSLVPKKGSRWHIIFGLIFFYAMFTMAGIASFLAAFSSHEPLNVLVGLFTLYLIMTSRQSIVNKKGTITLREKITSALSLILFSGFILLLIRAIQSGKSMIDGVYLEAYFVFVLLSSLALILDIKILVRGGVFGKHRIVRHLWRMILAMFIATTSVVYGQPQVFPEIINSSGVLDIVVLVIVLSLVFWLIRIYVVKRFIEV